MVECESELAVVRTAGGRELLDSEVLVVALEHPPPCTRQQLSRVAGWFAGSGAWSARSRDGVVVDQQPRGCAGARERGVAPPRCEIARRGDDDRGLDGRALHAVTGQRVGVLDVLGDVVRGQLWMSWLSVSITT